MRYVCLVESNGNVYVNGHLNYELSPKVDVQAMGIAGSPLLDKPLVVDKTGKTHRANYGPNVNIEAVSVCAVGLEAYVLDGENGTVYRYFRKGPGKGERKKDEGKSPSVTLKCVDMAVSGPESDESDRDVYVLAANGDVYLNGEKKSALSPNVNVEAAGLALDGTDVLVLTTRGTVFRNGQKDGISLPTDKECCGMTSWGGSVYVATCDGDVYENGEKSAQFSAKINSNFTDVLAIETDKNWLPEIVEEKRDSDGLTSERRNSYDRFMKDLEKFGTVPQELKSFFLEMAVNKYSQMVSVSGSADNSDSWEKFAPWISEYTGPAPSKGTGDSTEILNAFLEKLEYKYNEYPEELKTFFIEMCQTDSARVAAMTETIMEQGDILEFRNSSFAEYRGKLPCPQMDDIMWKLSNYGQVPEELNTYFLNLMYDNFDKLTEIAGSTWKWDSWDDAKAVLTDYSGPAPS